VSDRRTPPTLGEIIRRQRELAELPMRQLAAMVGISGPYLSQIERGLRAPSEHVLGAIATSLQTSAEALQDQAESLAPPAEPSEVVAAIERDPDLTTRQRQALIDVYTALIEQTVARRRRPRARDADGPGTSDGSGPVEG
jgi:transcriptional regulator with XRE-family HTH domain